MAYSKNEEERRGGALCQKSAKDNSKAGDRSRWTQCLRPERFQKEHLCVNVSIEDICVCGQGLRDLEGHEALVQNVDAISSAAKAHVTDEDPKR
jgi:hypothetical protein